MSFTLTFKPSSGSYFASFTVYEKGNLNKPIDFRTFEPGPGAKKDATIDIQDGKEEVTILIRGSYNSDYELIITPKGQNKGAIYICKRRISKNNMDDLFDCNLKEKTTPKKENKKDNEMCA